MTQRFRAVSAATALAGLLSAGVARSSDQQYQAVPLEPTSTESHEKVRGVGNPDIVSVIVKLDSPSLAAYKGQISRPRRHEPSVPPERPASIRVPRPLSRTNATSSRRKRPSRTRRARAFPAPG